MTIRNIVTFRNGGSLKIDQTNFEEKHLAIANAISQGLVERSLEIQKQFSERVGVIKSFVGFNFVFDPQISDDDLLVYRHLDFPNGLNLVTKPDSDSPQVEPYEFLVEPTFGFKYDLALHSMLKRLICNQMYWASKGMSAAA